MERVQGQLGDGVGARERPRHRLVGGDVVERLQQRGAMPGGAVQRAAQLVADLVILASAAPLPDIADLSTYRGRFCDDKINCCDPAQVSGGMGWGVTNLGPCMGAFGVPFQEAVALYARARKMKGLAAVGLDWSWQAATVSTQAASASKRFIVAFSGLHMFETSVQADAPPARASAGPSSDARSDYPCRAPQIANFLRSDDPCRRYPVRPLWKSK